MDERLQAKQAALALIVQDMSAEEISQCMWNLGFSNARFARRDDVDKAMRQRIAARLPEGVTDDEIPQEVVDFAHRIAKGQSIDPLFSAMGNAADLVRAQFFTHRGRPRKEKINALRAQQPRLQP